MLAYVLAIVIAIGSFSFYMAAFFVPEIHRRQDFFWSGVGLFYAVVLWFCAGRITGAVLLGQIASVALLGWLGWQTLELRRDLTPESVRTPITWEDLQHWGQAARQLLRKYLRMGSLLASAGAVWADIRNAISDMQNRIAGPRGEVRSRPTVPPLRRSPAYEFETETGQGESVPAEFATVPTRTQAQAAPRGKQQETLSPEAAASADTPPASVSDAPSEATTGPEQASPPPSEVIVSSQVGVNKPEDDSKEAAPKIKEPTPEIDSAKATTSRQTAATQATAKTSASTKAAAATTSKPPSTTPNRLVVLRDWFSDLLRSFRKPKPQRAVVEIPPRPPSIPRSPDKADKSKTSKASAKRAVIDIPPRPPSIPRPPKPAQANPVTKPDASDSNWVDVGDGNDQNWPTDSPASTTAKNTEKSQDKPIEADTASEQSAAAPSATPLDEPETNWPEEAIDRTASQNWPIDDDSETNWPND